MIAHEKLMALVPAFKSDIKTSYAELINAEDVNPKLIDAALKKYAKTLKKEDVIALMDVSLFNNGKSGFLLSSHALYGSSFPLWDRKNKSQCIPFQDLDKVIMIFPESGNPTTIEVTWSDGKSCQYYTGEQTGAIFRFLDKIIDISHQDDSVEIYEKAIALKKEGKDDEAVLTMEKAAEWGNELALLIEIGLCDKADDMEKAAYWLKKAAKLNILHGAEILLNLHYDKKITLEPYEAEKYAKTMATTSEIGETFKFGRYADEPIEWIVLKKEKGRTLVLSTKCITAGHMSPSLQGKTTWDNCSIRSWLNNNFYRYSFFSWESNVISFNILEPSENPDYKTNGGIQTGDYVFLLSVEEALNYLPLDSKAVKRTLLPVDDKLLKEAKVDAVYEHYLGKSYAVALPTRNAVEQKISVDKEFGTSPWWLRTPGAAKFSMSTVTHLGLVSTFGSLVFSDDIGIRPAMWLYNNNYRRE